MTQNQKAENSDKAQRDQTRDRMRGYGCSMTQIATEMARRFGLRPRAAWRHALGWPQWKVAQHYNTLHPGAKLSHNRVSECENWPHGGHAPSLRYLARLATTYGHGCTPAALVDPDDLEHLTPADRCLLTTGHPTALPATQPETTDRRTHPSRAIESTNGDTGMVWSRRRIVGCDARGVPVREEVRMAAEESAQFRRWSAITTNVDDGVLEQMAADIAEIAELYLIEPPAGMYARLVGARDDVFMLIAGRQQPRHTIGLYKVAGQVCALLAHATFDLGHPHAADTHARTALHCAEVSGHTPLRAFVRWVQSNVAYWAGRYDEAAQLIESALADASGTALLRLASQQARINAARHRTDEVSRALALAVTAPTDPTLDEPGVLAFAAGKAAYYASEAHFALGGTDHLHAAVDLARTAVDEFTVEPRPNAPFIAAARFDLALAYLGLEELEAVGEHLAPILCSTDAEYRTVPIIGRARSLHTLLGQRTDLASSTLAALRDDLAEFATHPAPVPPGLKPETT
ncbi:MAG: hypothetical protein ACRDTC_19200 [Pseudonocardiaceae bacterium]